MVLPLLIGGALGLVGAFMQNNQQKRAERLWQQQVEKAEAEPQIIRNEVDFKKMRDDAEAAGFNPLTVIRAGGIGGYNVQHHPNLHPIPNVDHSNSPMGNFLQGFGGQVMQYDFGRAERQRMEWQLYDAQMENLRADTDYRRGLGSVPVRTDSGREYGGGNISAGGPLGLPNQDGWIANDPAVTNPFSADWWYSHPGWADIGSGVEERYGEIGGALFFPIVLGADIGYTLHQNVLNSTGRTPMEHIQTWIQMAGDAMNLPLQGPMMPPPRELPQIFVQGPAR